MGQYPNVGVPQLSGVHVTLFFRDVHIVDDHAPGRHVKSTCNLPFDSSLCPFGIVFDLFPSAESLVLIYCTGAWPFLRCSSLLIVITIFCPSLVNR